VVLVVQMWCGGDPSRLALLVIIATTTSKPALNRSVETMHTGRDFQRSPSAYANGPK